MNSCVRETDCNKWTQKTAHHLMKMLRVSFQTQLEIMGSKWWDVSNLYKREGQQ